MAGKTTDGTIGFNTWDNMLLQSQVRAWRFYTFVIYPVTRHKSILEFMA